jgi:hypothetical protein
VGVEAEVLEIQLVLVVLLQLLIILEEEEEVPETIQIPAVYYRVREVQALLS